MLSKSELEQEKDSETMKSRKLVKLAEKYKRELEEANEEIRDLKAKLLESTEYKVIKACLFMQLSFLFLKIMNFSSGTIPCNYFI